MRKVEILLAKFIEANGSLYDTDPLRRPENHQGLAQNIFPGHKTPVTAVFGRAGIIPQHKEAAGRHGHLVPRPFKIAVVVIKYLAEDRIQERLAVDIDRGVFD